MIPSSSKLSIGTITIVTAVAILLGGVALVGSEGFGLFSQTKQEEASFPALGDPSVDAYADLAAGNATYIVVQSPTATTVPGLDPAVLTPSELREYRMYSPASTGLRGDSWTAFEARLRSYASAYNSVVHGAIHKKL